MTEDITQQEHDGRQFRRKLIWFVVIKVIVLALVGLFIAFYVV